MQALAIVDLLDEGADAGAGIGDVTVPAGVNFLLLESFHEALTFGVVVRIADPAHAGLDVMGGQQGRVVGAGILGGFKWSSQHPLSASLYGWL